VDVRLGSLGTPVTDIDRADVDGKLPGLSSNSTNCNRKHQLSQLPALGNVLKTINKLP